MYVRAGRPASAWPYAGGGGKLAEKKKLIIEEPSSFVSTGVHYL